MRMNERATRALQGDGRLLRRLLPSGVLFGASLASAACGAGGGTAADSMDTPGTAMPSGSNSGGAASGNNPGGAASGNNPGGAASGSHPGAPQPASDGGTTGLLDGAPPPYVLSPTSRLARLSHTQLLNTYRDLLGLKDVSFAGTTLTLDAVVNYDNESDRLFVADTLWQNLQTVAETYSHAVVSTPTLLAALVPAGAPTDTTGKATAFITALGLRAYRRPLTPLEVQTYLRLFGQGIALVGGTDPFAAGAELVLQAFLQSPHFIYRMELSDQVLGDRIPLSDYEVASKLSYAVTNTMPDPALLTAAAQGNVANSTSLATQAKRLLSTPAALAAVEHFHFQKYRFGVYDGITKDPAVYPQFTSGTGAAMRQESTLFLDWIFNNHKGVTDIYTSNVDFVNNLLAPTYGLSGTFTSAFTQVTLDPTARAGLLTQLGFLAEQATTGTDISTILRGAFVNEQIFCVTLPPPSPLARPLPPIMPGETDRQLVNGFTGPGTCAAGCHDTLLNPPGYAFENYDSVGAYRTTDQGQPVNAGASYTFAAPYGTQTWTTSIGFADVISRAPQVHQCYVQNWADYLYGRRVTDPSTGKLLAADAPYIQYLVDASINQGLSLESIILTMATNDNFLARSPQVN